MMNTIKLGRSAVVLMLFAFMTACTQSGSAISSYNGDLGGSSGISKKARDAKIKASRERARKKKEARKKAFLKKRQAGQKNRKLTRAERRKLKSKKTSKVRTKRKKTRRSTKRTKSTKRRIKTAKVSRKVRKAKKGKVQKIKKSTNAFVGGRSKGIRKSAPWRCVPPRLKSVIAQVSKKFGRVTINSTHRSVGYNRKVGGKRRSYHLRCQAVDFRVHGSTRGLTRWLARHPRVGGYKRYPSGFYHIDTGPKRTW